MSRTTLAGFQPDNPVEFNGVTAMPVSLISAIITHHSSFAAGVKEGLGYGK